MNFIKAILFFYGIVMIVSCSQGEKPIKILITNPLDIERSYETVTLTKSLLSTDSLNNFTIKDVATGKLLISQLVDNDSDGIMDELLFQPKIASKSKKKYEIISILNFEAPKQKTGCYSRFVPERTDDYAWENDRVAFRTFGPTAQQMVEQVIPGGTLTSGVDAWLKRVNYPIIDKWYKKETETDGTYHKDTGEGLDNFHVGSSRGVGGIAVKVDSIYFLSKNFIKWHTIANGPIQTRFSLDYGKWNANGTFIKESRIISLDLGTNLSKFEIFLEGTNMVSSGLTLHEKDGEISVSDAQNWVSYWQPHYGSELGTAILTTSKYYNGHETYDVQKKDLSNIFMHLKVQDGKVVYYAGFGWKGSGQFKTQSDWEDYLNIFSKKLKHPLMIEIED